MQEGFVPNRQAVATSPGDRNHFPSRFAFLAAPATSRRRGTPRGRRFRTSSSERLRGLSSSPAAMYPKPLNSPERIRSQQSVAPCSYPSLRPIRPSTTRSSNLKCWGRIPTRRRRTRSLTIMNDSNGWETESSTRLPPTSASC